MRNDLAFREELNCTVRCAVDADLGEAKDPEAILETNLRAAIQAEQVAGEIAEIAGAKRPAEAVRDTKGALVTWNAQRRVQRREVEVRLREVDVAIGIVAPTRPVYVSGSRPPNQPFPKWYGMDSDV